MSVRIFSASFVGLDCQIIEVQADISQGLPCFNIVGLGDTSVQESKERVRSSIKNSGAKFPLNRKTINLAPAQIRKQGALFDLPICIGLLIASNQLKADYFRDTLIVGELSLSGNLRAIKGALAITQKAKERGFKRIILPVDNQEEASFIDGIQICPVDSLKELIHHVSLNKPITPNPKNSTVHELPAPKVHGYTDISGLQASKRALEIAATGGHNVLLEGSPGCGKTVIARAFRDLLPPMTKQEILESSKIYSIAGLLNYGQHLLTQRPFREVHHTASSVAIIGGGGHQVKVGEITLAHNGVLFLDEIAEFTAKTLDALRQPLEDKFITITRLNRSFKFPSNFMLIATMNPCPCGFHGDKKIHCKCTKYQRDRYRKSISGPILDRFDLYVRPKRFQLSKNFNKNTLSKNQRSLQEIRQSIIEARALQAARLSAHGIKQNSDMSLKQVTKLAKLTNPAQQFLNQATNSMSLTNRGYLKSIKIARSIADLAQSSTIQKEHIAEALQYRYSHSQE